MGRRDQLTILLVEDNEIDVMGVKRAFRQSQYSYPIVVAKNGVEALDKLREGREIKNPYLILLDLNMPRMNGIEFLKEVRSDQQLRSSIIYILTTSKAQDDKDKAYQHNVAGYIVKEGRAGEFIDVASFLDHYYNTVEFP
ncbi:MAG: response regulator [Micavibrio aeruginosavorus]|uniref:Response regulator n=1 Tax=Micavibrio aeruginosavorus TaxID=349221 RepID=A0A7T5R0M2_9BACT|nr:MAG: response regulator [Micavibrio aeruginosavorus]